MPRLANSSQSSNEEIVRLLFILNFWKFILFLTHHRAISIANLFSPLPVRFSVFSLPLSLFYSLFIVEHHSEAKNNFPAYIFSPYSHPERALYFHYISPSSFPFFLPLFTPHSFRYHSALKLSRYFSLSVCSFSLPLSLSHYQLCGCLSLFCCWLLADFSMALINNSIASAYLLALADTYVPSHVYHPQN